MTLRDAIVDIDLGDGAGKRKVPFADVHRVIGELLQGSQFGQAAAISVQLAEQRPRDAWPQLVAAESLYLHQQIEPANRYIERALQLAPSSVPGLIVKARLCVLAGDSRDAVRLLEQAVAVAPDDARVHAASGEVLKDAGEIAGARDSYRRAIELDPRNVDAMLGIAHLPGAIDASLIEKFAAVADAEDSPRDDRITARFALARVYERQGDNAAMLASLQAGNAMKRSTLGYDPAASRREADAIVDVFSTQYFADRRAIGGNPARVVFIVGFPRCGSTLVEQILASHTDVTAAGETLALRHAMHAYQRNTNTSDPYPAFCRSLEARSITAIADDYLARIAGISQTDVVTDKLLDNYRCIGLIHLMFPNARIVDVRRDPIDTCFSCYGRMFNQSALPYAYDLDDLANRYRDYATVMRHWHAVLPGRVHTVRYEDLVGRQSEVTGELLDYCGLSWQDACLEFYDNARPVMTNSNVQVRQPMYADSIGRGRRLAEHLGALQALIE